MGQRRFARVTPPGFLRSRRGVAAVEAAVALPVLVALVFGSIELANGIFLKQTLTVAAYEGARAVTRPGATSAEAKAAIDEILRARGVTEYEVVITPEATVATPRQTPVTVRVVAPAGGNLLPPLRLLSGVSIEKTVCMVRL